MPYVTVKRRHQVTIPSKLRQKLPIDEGDILEVSISNGTFVLTPQKLENRPTSQSGHTGKREKQSLRMRRMNDVVDRFRDLPVRDARDIDTILYDDNGLPR